jgi:hypothetical protein
MINELINLSDTNRILDLERLSTGAAIKGDFDGSVTGSWVKLGERGEGIVSYNDKQYTTKPLGFVSIPAGTEVELSFANGVYYSKY